MKTIKIKKKVSSWKSFWIDVPTFKTGVRVVVSPDIKRVKSTIEKWYRGDYSGFEELEDAGCDLTLGYGKTIYKNGYAPTIWLPYMDMGVRRISTAAHECFHAAVKICNAHHIEDEEACAYLTEQILREILEHYESKFKT